MEYEILTENEYELKKLKKELKKQMDKQTPEEKLHDWYMFVTFMARRNNNK